MSGPFFSIIIPTFNCGTKLRETLDSVLAQAGAPFEILVMDGASTDDTLEVIEAQAEKNPDLIRWVSRKDDGIYDAMNKGIDLARGKYLYFLGAGDMLRTGVLARILEIANDQETAFIYGNVYWASRDMIYDHEFDRAKMAVRTPCHQSIFYHKAIFDTLGKYDTQYRYSADWALNMRCFRSRAIEKIYLDLIIADYEGQGISDIAPDTAFIRDRKSLLANNLGVRLREKPFFAVERTLATRIERAGGYLPRKFWHAQLWLLHKLVRPLLPKRLRAITRETRVDEQYWVKLLEEN